MSDIKSILANNKKKKLLKSNPEARQIAEIIISESIGQIVSDLSDKVELAIVDLKGRSLKGDKGDRGETGPQGPKGLDGIEGPIGPQGPMGIKGEPGIKGNDGLNGRDGKDGKDGSPDTPQEIADKLNTLTEKVERKVIIGLDDMIKKLWKALQEKKSSKQHGGGDIINYYDLTSQCDGLTKTFTVPINRKIIGVFGTQFPINLRPDIDWTGSGTTTLTLTSEVGAPQTGQTLWILYVV